ncbi:MAG: phosphoglycerate dehydrogenase [Bifidobacteriaceae bacterium]|jgi:D-3-phosphoglycerate dehydrogenase|nr:phosphoglycerate dehydrogenase [Bifidobacteriaceae bacterium]
MTYRVKTLNAISQTGLSRLPADSYEVGSEVSDPDAIMLRSFKLHGVPIPASVKAVARAGAGTNNIPIPDYSALGIPVFNTPGANANAVKELVIAAIFLAARNIVPGATFAHRLEGDPDSMTKAVESGKKNFVGFELPGRTLGVIGLGAVGILVANAAAALGMRVLGFDPAITVEHAWKLNPSIERVASPDTLLKAADIVTVHVPLLPATTGLIGAEQIGHMRPDAVLLNFARGPIVDEAAVIAALEAGQLRSYICDFPSPALNKHENVVTLPHLGASTGEAEENCAVMAADELRAYLEDGNIVNSVNFPAAEMARTEGATRVTIANRNDPGVIGEISTLVGGAGLNILGLLNKSRGDLAYNIVDVAGDVPTALVEKLRAADGVLAVRIIA